MPAPVPQDIKKQRILTMMSSISLEEREHAEKLRSAREAFHAPSSLLTSAHTVARYRSPPEKTVYPLEYAFHLLGDVNGKVILEYGCGDGENTVVLAKRGAKIIALDISPELLERAKERLDINGCNGVEVLVGSAHELPLPDQSVDIIFGMAILHHLDLEIASREVRRVLKKGGRAIFQEPVRNSMLLARVRRLFPLRADVSPFERPLTDAQIKDFAGPCNCKGRSFQLFLCSVASLLPRRRAQAIRLSARVDAALLRLLPWLRYFATVKVFELVKE
jgi:SAM-dependent methyltransferase